MRACMEKMEKGQFLEAIAEVTKSIKLMSKVLSKSHFLTIAVNVPDPSVNRSDIKFAVAYKLSLLILHKLKQLESEKSNLATMALLTKFLADIPLQPKHRVVCMRMAINRNMEANNFGLASRLLEVFFRLFILIV